jgi:hypothetical protein
MPSTPAPQPNQATPSSNWASFHYLSRVGTAGPRDEVRSMKSACSRSEIIGMLTNLLLLCRRSRRWKTNHEHKQCKLVAKAILPGAIWTLRVGRRNSFLLAVRNCSPRRCREASSKQEIFWSEIMEPPTHRKGAQGNQKWEIGNN